MEPETRRIAEKLVEDYLTVDRVRYFIETVQDFKPLIKSERDAVFGWIMGIIEARFLAVLYATKRRIPSKEELVDLYQILKRRSYEMIEVISRELMR